MNENFKNSFKGFKVKGILIVLGALLVIALAANGFNSGKGFYVFCGVIALLAYVAFVIVSILKNKAENENKELALKQAQQAAAEKAATKKAFDNRIAQLEKERNEAEYLLAQEKAKAKAAADTAAQAVKNQQKAEEKAQPAQQQAKSKKSTKK